MSSNIIMLLSTLAITNLNLFQKKGRHRFENAECLTQSVSIPQLKANHWIPCLESTSKRSTLWNIMLRSGGLVMSTRPPYATSNSSLSRFGMKTDSYGGKNQARSPWERHQWKIIIRFSRLSSWITSYDVWNMSLSYRRSGQNSIINIF